MPLNDFIRQEADHRNNMQLTMINIEQRCDKAISDAISECINKGTKALYDEICKSIASILSSGASSAEGDVPFPDYCFLNYRLQDRLYDFIPNNISDDDKKVLRDIVFKKGSASPFLKEHLRTEHNDDLYVSALEIWIKKSDWWGTKKTILKGAYFQPFWDTLYQLAAMDRVQLAYMIEVQDIVRDKSSHWGHSTQHSHYLQFGEYVKCIDKSDPGIVDRLIGERPHTIRPVVLFKYVR